MRVFFLVLFAFHGARADEEFYLAHLTERSAVERGQCGWLADVLQSARGDRRAVYERAPTGLADIWSSMLTAAWWSVSNGVRLAVHWPESVGVIDLPVETVKNDDLARLDPNLTYFKYTHDAFARDWLTSLSKSEGDVVLSGNRGLTHVAFGDATLRAALARRGVPSHVDSWRGAACFLHRLAKPTRETFRSIAAILKRVQAQPTVCVHLRTGLMPEVQAKQKCQRPKCKARPDDEMHGAEKREVTADDVGNFLECAEKAGGPNAKWYVTADSASVRRSIVQRYGDRIILAPWSPDPFAAYQHRGGSSGGSSAAAAAKRRVVSAPLDERASMREALRRTFAEWYTLAHCDHLVLSRSGFSRTAGVVARSLRNASVHLVSHLGGSRCSPNFELRAGDHRAGILLTGGAGI